MTFSQRFEPQEFPMNRHTTARSRDQKQPQPRGAEERGRSSMAIGRHMPRLRREAAHWAEASFEIAAWMRQR